MDPLTEWADRAISDPARSEREYPRLRLMLGMVTAVGEKGYAAVTVADVVAAAGVSKRTFYEHFAAKDDCLLACYDEASDNMASLVRAASTEVPPGPERVACALDTYFAALDRHPRMTAALLMEVQAAGAAGRTLRRRKNAEFAELMCELAAGRLDSQLALAVIGGVNELVLAHAESGSTEPYRVAAPAARRFMLAVMDALP
jgi:AcrR family transcriptional regulator